MSRPALSPLDTLIGSFDRALRSLTPGTFVSERPYPAENSEPSDLNDGERAHAAGLMRVNHAGEVCAQALYQGQGLTARLNHVRDEMTRAADEEIDHLAWCERRLSELNAKPSVLNPIWYTASFALGAAAGAISDRVSLGFVAATEDLVTDHLAGHLSALPSQDHASRAVVAQMQSDESDHAESARQAGAINFPGPVRAGMRMVAKVMTTLSYRV